MMRRILHVDLDSFFVSVERARHPELGGRPVVVGGDPGGRGVVSCASYEARRYGLRAGMPLATAHRLCPQAIFLKGSFSRYQEASTRFLHILSQFSPDLEPLGIDEAYLDLTGFEPLYGPARDTAERLRRRIAAEIGVTASVGIAGSKLVAKVASDQAKPDRVLEVAPGEERSFLAPLPVGVLPGVGPKTEGVLKRMGISTIGQLAAQPPVLLSRLFGFWGYLLHSWANGLDDRRVEPPGPARSISRETTFARDTRDRRFLRAILRYLSERVGAELRVQRKQARCVALKLRYADFQTLSRSRTLKEASDADGLIFKVGLGLLEKALEQRRHPVRLVGIGASHLVGEGRQLHLFDSSPERQASLNRAIDRIRSRYGFLAIQTGQTWPLKEAFPTGDGDYLLRTPALSR